MPQRPPPPPSQLNAAAPTDRAMLPRLSRPGPCTPGRFTRTPKPKGAEAHDHAMAIAGIEAAEQIDDRRRNNRAPADVIAALDDEG